MATTEAPPLVSVAQYLATTYSPDRDYVDGVVRERNLGEFEHSRLQTLLAGWFLEHEEAWSVVVLAEQRVQVSATRFRVPDVCVLGAEGPSRKIVREAPIACFEVLSPEDTLGGMEDRVTDYLRMGVQHVWIVDPVARRVWACSESEWRHVDEPDLVIPGTPIFVPIRQLLNRVPRAID